jgi:hypothetical protein
MWMIRETAAGDVQRRGAVPSDRGVKCRTGNRSGHIQKAPLDRGFTDVFDVVGGMAGSRAGGGWIRERPTVEPCPLD